jgi:tetratricopeptide (TPR) repeat protein
MVPRSLIPTLLAFLAVTAVVEPAAGAAEPKNKVEARDWYQRGIRHYELGELDLAAQELKRAYELNPAPGLLFNLGQVYRLKKDDEQALHFYRTYLRLQPEASNRAMVESLMAEIKAHQEEKARTPAAEPAPSPNAPGASAPAPLPPAAPTLSAPVAPPSVPPRKPRLSWKAQLGIGGGAAALGMGALGAAIGLGLHANDEAGSLGRESDVGGLPWDGPRQARYSDGERSATAATALYVIGGVLIAGGVVVGALALRQRHLERRQVALVPTGSPEAACAW